MRPIILAMQETLSLVFHMARSFVATGIIYVVTLSACASPMAINKAMIAYDEAVLRAENELLLLNVLRARDDEPMHFTVTSSIAATFHFQVNGGIGGHMFSSSPHTAYNANFLSLNLGGEASESPTVQIIPIQGEEFTRRILMPLDQGKFEFLTNQSSNIGAILRLTVQEIEVESRKKDLHLLRNSPGYREEYLEFRRFVQHLAYLYATRRLYVGPLIFDDTLEVPDQQTLSKLPLDQVLDGRQRLERRNDNRYVISRTVVGRIMIMDVNPFLLSNQERLNLNRRFEHMKSNAIPVIMMRDSAVTGDPLTSVIRLRSFAQIMKFLANGLGKEPEYDVEPDDQTGVITGAFGRPVPDPPQTFKLHSGPEVPSREFISTVHKGQAYWLEGTRNGSEPIREASWDLEIFGLLYQIFQLTVSEGTQNRGLPITIAK